MYTGHAAVALILKTRAPEVPMTVLAVAAYGPDILEIGLMIPQPRGGTGIYTHSIPSIIVGSLVASLLWKKLGKGSALIVAAAWCLHLVLDLFTGRKPLILPEHLTGLDLYHLTWADAAIECALMLVACVMYARAFAHTGSRRRILMLLAAALIALQIEFDIILPRMDPLPWNPSLAFAVRPWHFSSAQLA